MFKLNSPVDRDSLMKLKAGDIIQLSGTVLTARDKAHQRIIEYLREEKSLPFKLDNSVIYHCGPLMKKDVNSNSGRWRVIASGPTTSARMNKSTVEILNRAGNLSPISPISIAIMGKGGMDKSVASAMKKLGTGGGAGVYLAVTGGTGALTARSVRNVKTVYWEDLGMAEAVWVFEIENLSCVVGIDSQGNSIYLGNGGY